VCGIVDVTTYPTARPRRPARQPLARLTTTVRATPMLGCSPDVTRPPPGRLDAPLRVTVGSGFPVPLKPRAVIDLRGYGTESVTSVPLTLLNVRRLCTYVRIASWRQWWAGRTSIFRMSWNAG
jgi:hypothetical protein